jgi:hypothetical protein
LSKSQQTPPDYKRSAVTFPSNLSSFRFSRRLKVTSFQKCKSMRPTFLSQELHRPNNPNMRKA